MDVGTIVITIFCIVGISVGVSAWFSRFYYQRSLERRYNKIKQSLSQPLRELTLHQNVKDRAFRNSVIIFIAALFVLLTTLFSLALYFSFSSFVAFLTYYENDQHLWLYISGIFLLVFGLLLLGVITCYFVGMRNANKQVEKEQEDVAHSFW